MEIHKLFLVLYLVHCTCDASFLVPELPRDAYVMHGDLDIGGIFRVHEYEQGKVCGTRARNTKGFQYLESMVYAINHVNKRDDILPNISLGYVILDDCLNQQTAYSRALQFIPVTNQCFGNASLTTPRYDVIGVVSGSNSGNTMAAGSPLNIFRIPMVGAVATSELLSNKVQYEYFIRVVPPDNYQARAIIDILLHFNWSYVSALNSEGGYGANGIKRVAEYARKNGICIAYSEEISAQTAEDEFDRIMENLLRHKTARVVVLFTNNVDGRKIMEAAQRARVTDHFIWIASDSVSPSSDLNGIENVAAAGFYIQLYSRGGASGFQEYFGSLNPTNTTNPWLHQLWEREFGCTFNTSQVGVTLCTDITSIFQLPGYQATNNSALFMDTILTFAYAVENLVHDKCPEGVVQKHLLRSCVSGKLLLAYMKNLTFEGASGTIQFDESGDAYGKYRILQLQESSGIYEVFTVGYWDKLSESLTNMTENPYWGNRSDTINHVIPESVCSKPCLSNEFIIPQELKCCWECRKCRDNEIVVKNRSSCEKCPELKWPDQTEFSRCVDIKPTYIEAHSPTAIVCLSLAIIGLVTCVFVIAVFVKNQHEKLIKATSRELSFITLFGVMMSYLSVTCIILPPSPPLCIAGRIGFIMSFAVVYAPLLTKTSRIYRIFSAAKHGKQRPRFISSKLQIIFSSILIGIQVNFTRNTFYICLFEVSSFPQPRTNAHKYADRGYDDALSLYLSLL